MMLVMSTALRVCPLGNDGEVSSGGTACSAGGLARAVRSLPRVVIVSDPAVAPTMTTMGVQVRHHRARARTVSVARMVIPTLPPRLVNQVAAVSSHGIR